MASLDELVKKAIVAQMVRDDRIDASRVNVEVDSGIATLRGEVPTYYARAAAFDAARDTMGVVNVINQLVVRYHADTLIPTDFEIENSVIQRLSANPDIDLVDMEVIVQDGVVTLKGSVDAYWKKLHAENIVANESGVKVIENHLAVVPTDNVVDKSIAQDIIDSLENRASVNADDVNVRVTDGYVTLTGFVPSWSARQASHEAAVYTAGVTGVENQLEIMRP
jgi:osmotically-inducible protein OsmY